MISTALTGSAMSASAPSSPPRTAPISMIMNHGTRRSAMAETRWVNEMAGAMLGRAETANLAETGCGWDCLGHWAAPATVVHVQRIDAGDEPGQHPDANRQGHGEDKDEAGGEAGEFRIEAPARIHRQVTHAIGRGGRSSPA